MLGGVLGLLGLVTCLVGRRRLGSILPFVLVLSAFGALAGGALGMAFLAWRGAVLGVFAAVPAACFSARIWTTWLVSGLLLGTTAEALLANPTAWSSALAGALVAGLLVPLAVIGMGWALPRRLE